MTAALPEQITAYIQQTYGAEPEFLWARTPNNAVFRHYKTGKWFAALLLGIPRRSLGLSGDGQVDILDLKCSPAMVGSLLDGTKYLPAYHMNKEHWITVLADGSVALEELIPLLNLSYQLVSEGKRRRSTATSNS